jgi:hypothetical protein
VTDGEPGSAEATHPVRHREVECRKSPQVGDGEFDRGSITFMHQGRVEMAPNVEGRAVPIGYE